MRLCWFTQTRPITRVSNARQGWDTRTSTLVVVEDNHGRYGIGEASPLLGYSDDSTHDVENTLHAVAAIGVPLQAHMSLPEVLTIGQETLVSPSALFALQTACLDLWSKQRGTRLQDELENAWCPGTPGVEASARAPLEVRVAPLLDIYSPAMEQTALALAHAGFTTFKVKVGFDLARELENLQRLQALARNQGFSIVFRLDANRSIKTDVVGALLEPFKNLPVEYVEEPCAIEEVGPEDIPLPVGLDESLRLGETRLESWLCSSRLAAIVCKPMIMGDLKTVLAWHRRARGAGCQFVFSHLFDGSVALRMYRLLARVLAPNTCHGLAEHAGLVLWSEWVHDSAGPGLGLELTNSARQALPCSRGMSR
jgi:L-alanine-DL-glutamate epimerase-like enolase superfamily enzyme